MSEIMLQAMEKLQRELDEARTQEKWHFDNYVYTQELYNELREQMDALAKALEELIRLDDQMNDPDYEESGTYAGAYYCYYKGESRTWGNAREALAAVKGEEPEDPHKYCRGGGGNNFHCGCKYDAQNHESYYP